MARKQKFKSRRPFDRSAFKAKTNRDRILQCDDDAGNNHGSINVTKLERTFPNKQERLTFINAMIAKMEE